MNRQPLARLSLCLMLLFSMRLLEAQNQGAEAPYLLPQTIFVGDSGRLVVPLGQAFALVEPFVMESPSLPDENPELVIKRIELERRGGISRLFIDFIPYAPGTVSFPDIELSSGGEEVLALTNLKAGVASILDSSQMNLSESAPSLAVPGTGLLVYGTVAALLVLFFAGIGGSIWGRRHFREILEWFRRRHLLNGMRRFLRRLRHDEEIKKNRTSDYYLTLLSGELRKFLSLFTGINCRSLSAAEFAELPPIYAMPHNADGKQTDTIPDENPLDPVFLCRLFRSWDTLRFSGRIIERADFINAVDETCSFIAALDRVERERKYSAPDSESREIQRTETGEAAYEI